MNCPICNNQGVETSSVYDDRFGYPGAQVYFKCLRCEHVYLEHSFVDSDISKLYSQYYARDQFDINSFKPNPQKSHWKNFLDGIKSSTYTWVPRGVKVLDIGCGLGQAVAYHEGRGCEAYGIDADSNICRIAEKYGFNLKNGLFDEHSYPGEFFDYITLDQVVEHIIDPQNFLLELKANMNEDSRCLVSFPNVEGLWRKIFGVRWMNWHAPYHLHLYSQESFNILCKGAGFRVSKRKVVTHSSWLYFQINHCLFFPDLETKNKFWTNQIQFDSTSKYYLYRLNRILLKLHFFDIVTRIVDFLGLGDNVVYEIRKI